MTSFRAALLPLLASLLCALSPLPRAHAQCEPQWSSAFSSPALDGDVFALAYDTSIPDGPLYAGGVFAPTPDLPAMNIARWDGQTWWPLGEGVNGPVHALVFFDEDGPGPLPRSLYVGGDFTTAGGQPAAGLARWDGREWHAVGTGFSGSVRALLAAAEPDGPALYVGGRDLFIAGNPARGIARYSAVSSWNQVADGLDGEVRALAFFQSHLHAGGEFALTGDGLRVNNLARLIGPAWIAVDGGVSSPSGDPPARVNALAVFELQLYVAGQFSHAGLFAMSNVARWSGLAWSPAPGVQNMVVNAMALSPTHNAGIYFVGRPTSGTGGVLQYRRLLGSSGTTSGFDAPVFAVALRDREPVDRLYLGGGFRTARGIHVGGVCQWTPRKEAHPLTFGAGLAGTPRALATIDLCDGDGPAVYAGGLADQADETQASFVARWRGGRWTPLPGLDGLISSAIAAFDDDGDGPNPARLYVARWSILRTGYHTKVYRWDDDHWTQVGSFTHGHIRAMTVHNDASGPALYVGGDNLLKRWDGHQWTDVGGGPNGSIAALLSFDPDGDGPAPAELYAAGQFSAIGNPPIPAANIARWNGHSWSPLGDGLTGPAGVHTLVLALAAFDDDGDGPNPPALIAAGAFTEAGGAPAPAIARWDGISWSPLGDSSQPPSGSIHALAAFDDGSGPALIAAGFFNWVAGVPASNIARWDGTNWSSIGALAPGGISALAVFHDHGPASPAALYASGSVRSADGRPSFNIARWGAPAPITHSPPRPRTAIAGRPAQFYAGAAGAPDLAFQWRRDGLPLADGSTISGAATPRLTIDPVTLNDAGLYDVLISNPCGTLAPDPALLRVFCSADWNQDGDINSADITAFLTAWRAALGTASLLPDFNASGVLDSADISAFLSAWLSQVAEGC